MFCKHLYLITVQDQTRPPSYTDCGSVSTGNSKLQVARPDQKKYTQPTFLFFPVKSMLANISVASVWRGCIFEWGIWLGSGPFFDEFLLRFDEFFLLFFSFSNCHASNHTCMASKNWLSLGFWGFFNQSSAHMATPFLQKINKYTGWKTIKKKAKLETLFASTQTTQRLTNTKDLTRATYRIKNLIKTKTKMFF